METERIRLVFDGRHLLTESQKSEGLKRCWLLLKPEIHTISDLVSHLIHKFSLQDVCPDGLLLSMEGFVLPPFESTSIFKDKDTIRKRKTRPSSPEKYLNVSSEGAEKDARTKQNGSIHDKGNHSRKNLKVKDSSRNVNDRSEVMIGPQDNHKPMEVIDCSPNETEFDQLQESSQKNADTSHILDGTRKFPSRSARRKKAKRQWLRELANSQKKELIQNHEVEKDVHPKSPEHQQPDQKTDMEDEIVPIEVRPGHIRFEPIDDGQSNWQLQDKVETLQWSGTTSKKKGQKWGKEKISVFRRNGDYPNDNWNEKFRVEEEELVTGTVEFENVSSSSCLHEGSGTAPKKGQDGGKGKVLDGTNDDWGLNYYCNHDVEMEHDRVDFEKLMPLSCLPKEGDVVAYRLVELSSSWCPELSSFRVGKVSSYDSVSKKIILVPVPEYPIISVQKRDEEFSVYNEDGYLEIDFASLVDVRIFSGDKSDPVRITTGISDEAPLGIQEAVLSMGSDHNAKNTPPPITENGGSGTGWEEISRVLSERKSQLLQEDGLATKGSSAKTGWSYQGLRGSALGPTIALLRAQNEL
ncbi:sphere organelles protein-like protein isoform X2 [Tasmannia lanceolata]|uniref:sphere organelles protein-like protein isoform X2 n=1 Tax=Tasmannia lanceolata TaxID=3420 RepID=UPI004062E51F